LNGCDADAVSENVEWEQLMLKPMKSNPLRHAVGLALFASLCTFAADPKKLDLTKLPPPSDLKGLTYAKDIKPILEKACFECHGPAKQKGKLRVDSLADALKGGEAGKVIQAGKSASSVLVHAVARLDPDLAMPPKGDPLTKEQISQIRAWIDQGAK
jgi:hypothetical protein